MSATDTKAGSGLKAGSHLEKMFAAGHFVVTGECGPPKSADADIVAYCRGAYCVLAHDAVRLLHAQGREAVRLQDGLLEWRTEGNPVEVVA